VVASGCAVTPDSRKTTKYRVSGSRCPVSASARVEDHLSSGKAGIARSAATSRATARPTIGDRFCLELASLYLKIVRQLGGGGDKASDATIGVLKDNELKFPAAL
jgi:hypothetical protein